MNKRTRKLQFDTRTTKKIIARDRKCLFCRLNYHMEDSTPYECSIFDIMHYINRSQGGLGVEENGVLGCRHHHMLLDNGNKGLRPEMVQIMKDYLIEQYDFWDESQLYYKKGE